MTKCGVRADQIVVNRFGKAEHIQPLLHQRIGHFMSAVASQANETIESETIVSFHGSGGEINGLAVRQRHAVGLLSACAQDRAAGRENRSEEHTSELQSQSN